MLRTGLTLSLALFVVATAPSVARPADDLKVQLDTIQKTLDALTKDLDDIKKGQLRIGLVETRLELNEKSVAELRAAVKLLADEIARRADDRRDGRVAKSFTPQALPGSIRIANYAPYRATVILNGAAYEVPGQRYLDVPNVPSGAFTYEVILDAYGTIQPQTARYLMPGQQSYPITINWR